MPRLMDMLRCLGCGVWFPLPYHISEPYSYCEACRQAVQERAGKLPERGTTLDKKV